MNRRIVMNEMKRRLIRGSAAARTALGAGWRVLSTRWRALPQRTRTITLASGAVVPVIFVFLLVVISPVSRLRHAIGIDSQAAAKRDTGPARAETSLPREKSIPALRLDEAFWSARLALAAEGSVSLAVDLVDSVASVEIRGVPVRVCKIRRFSTGNAIRLMLNQSKFLSELSKPLSVVCEAATLPKEPIHVISAPRDTIEAAKAAARPFEPEVADVYYILSLNDAIALTVTQLEDPSLEGFRRIVGLRMKRYLGQAGQALSSLARMDLPRHTKQIEITLDREDAKAIYRALSKDAGCALRL
jgi:hypothetical protein